MPKGYGTNLASEFFALSTLYRLGLNAHLTLGLRKNVDILIEKPSGEILTVDVKGMDRPTAWFVENIKRIDENHFIIFICYLGKIEDPNVIPEIYIIPSIKLKNFIHTNPGGVKQVLLSHLRKKAENFKDAWELLIK